jgi:hypothetical protein
MKYKIDRCNKLNIQTGQVESADWLQSVGEEHEHSYHNRQKPATCQ